MFQTAPDLPAIRRAIGEAPCILVGVGSEVSEDKTACNNLFTVIAKSNSFVITSGAARELLKAGFSPDGIYMPLDMAGEFGVPGRERMLRLLTANSSKSLLLFELGADSGAPGLISYPFELLLLERNNTSLLRINRKPAQISLVASHPRSLIIKADPAVFLAMLAA